jgi:sucrose-6-phosphate hydrolase SacC (GH32 family)
MSLSLKQLPSLSPFDPEQGQTIIQPLDNAEGNWVGACNVVYDDESKKYFLYYRIRQPRPVRGGKCVIAESSDGIHFNTIWETTKESLDSTSIEKASMMKAANGKWRLYMSYVDPADQRWRTDVIEADSPAQFDIANRQKVFTAADLNVEGVKDPYCFTFEGKTYLLLSYAPGKPNATEADKSEMHSTSDIYNTAHTKSSSGLAVSEDGITFEWLGDIFAPSESGWDCHAARLGSILFRPPVFIGFYDGGPTHLENYEEKTGIAVSSDLKTWHRVSVYGPAITSPHGTGSLRYMDPLEMPGETRYYYEYARADGAHEIRLNIVKHS